MWTGSCILHTAHRSGIVPLLRGGKHVIASHEECIFSGSHYGSYSVDFNGRVSSANNGAAPNQSMNKTTPLASRRLGAFNFQPKSASVLFSIFQRFLKVAKASPESSRCLTRPTTHQESGCRGFPRWGLWKKAPINYWCGLRAGTWQQVNEIQEEQLQLLISYAGYS